MRLPIPLAFVVGLAMSAPMMTAVTAPAQAEVQTGFGDFTNKRVKPPRADAKRRITVQIKPGDALKPPKPRAKPKTEADTDKASVAVGAAPGQLAWFWEAISPDLTASGPGRLEPALRRIAAPPSGAGVPAPRLGTLMQIARAHQADILLTTAGTNVSPALVLAVIAVESAGRVDAVSGAGAAGLMQLMPATAERFGVADRSNAADNIKGGVAFLDMLMTRFGGDPILVLAGYNAGENSIKTHSGVPPYAETRDYVPKVLAAFEVARNLCRTRPQLISDGCVFSFPS